MIIYGPAMIDRGAGPPPWIQLRDLLREQITSGQLSGRLPSEKTLSQTYEVAIGTVRKAIEALRGEGLVYTQRGWGTFTVTPGK
jgi:GntR family transcriptional regulator